MITHIDMLGKTAADALNYSISAPPFYPAPAILISQQVREELIGQISVIDGYEYLGDYQVITDMDSHPKPKDPPTETLAMKKNRKISEINGNIRKVVDEHVSPEEREQYTAVMNRINYLKANGQAVNAQVEATVVALLNWCEDAMIYATDLVIDITLAADDPATDAIICDLNSLTSTFPSKPPPGQLLKLLRA